jgi:hypothetical protein
MENGEMREQPTRKPPQKRLVSKGKYVFLLGKTISLYTLGMVAYCGGLLLLLPLFADVIGGWGYRPAGITALRFLIGSGIVALTLFAGKRMLVTATAIELVTPITSRYTQCLSAQEILVRASEKPPVDAQTELLRAAQTGNEAPAEELLRSAKTNGQD